MSTTGNSCGMAGKREPACYTARELAKELPGHVPDEYNTAKHLVYSSPATLAFNSPGAEGFGVKRAGLSIPGSVMLIVSPGCCGRNTSEITKLKGYEERFFYLLMDETDLVTGRHLKKIPQAVKEIVEFLPEKPSVVMICITCVDALLGTDMERVARKAQEEAQVPVRPCYMYALTREGRRPPMVHVRQSLYSMVPKRKKKGTSVNFLGFFAPLMDDFELYGMLRGIGVKKIREISRCKDIEEFYDMGEANFNLVLNSEAAPAADDLSKRLGIPYILLQRFYDVESVKRQYAALGKVLGSSLESRKGEEAALRAVQAVKEKAPGISFSIGESMNGNPFEMALALAKYGFRVDEVYGNPDPSSTNWIRRLAAISPDTRIYSNMEPTMLYYDSSEKKSDFVIGKDAAFYQPDALSLPWNEDVQPYGYAGITKLFRRILEKLEESGAERGQPYSAAAIRQEEGPGGTPAEGKGGRP